MGKSDLNYYLLFYLINFDSQLTNIGMFLSDYYVYLSSLKIMYLISVLLLLLFDPSSNPTTTTVLQDSFFVKVENRFDT